jgi:molybdopterin-containing oxidoreductase family molybdopterin binding subunit
LRGDGQWEQITWDEAIKYITDKWKGYIEEYGGSSICFYKGTGSYAQEQYYFSIRLRTVLGACNVDGGYDMNALHMVSLILAGGNFPEFEWGNAPADILNAKYIFFWGSNATISDPCRWIWTQLAKESGAELIAIDPNYTGVASKAHQWVPIRPGTDSALLMAMCNVAISENLLDRKCLLEGSVAPFLVKASNGKFLRLSDMGVDPTEGPVNPYTGQPTLIDPIVVRGEDGSIDVPENITNPVLEGSFNIEGIEVTTAYSLLLDRIAEWTPEKASELCDIPLNTIIELARKFAEGPTSNVSGFGSDHWVNGSCSYHSLVTLMILTGQIAKPGSGLQGVLGGSSSGYGVDFLSMAMVEGFRAGPSFTLAALIDIMNTGRLGENPHTVKSLYTFYGNPMACFPERKTLIEAIDKIELYIVADTFMTDSARYADIILPVPHWFEINTFCVTVTPFARINEKAVDPLYESKSDIEIANLIAEGMGLSDAMGMTEDEIFESMLNNDTAKALGLTWTALKEKKSIRVLPDDFIFAPNYVFPTPTKRAEFYLETIFPYKNQGQTIDQQLWSLPYWEPPHEAWKDNPLIETYPLTLMSHRDRFKTHTIFSLQPWLEELRPEPTLNINSIDAETRGIKENDYVKAFNDRGSVVLRAHIHDGMRPGVVDTEHTWFQERYKEGHYADLTSRVVHGLGTGPAHYDTLCQVEKV